MQLEDFPEGFDIESQLANILQDEIWKEITAETGYTQKDLDNEIITELKLIVASKVLK